MHTVCQEQTVQLPEPSPPPINRVVSPPPDHYYLPCSTLWRPSPSVGTQSGKKAGSPTPSHHLTRAVHGNFSLVWGNCPGLAAHPLTFPPREQQTVCGYGREAGTPKLIPLGPHERFLGCWRQQNRPIPGNAFLQALGLSDPLHQAAVDRKESDGRAAVRSRRRLSSWK